MINCSHICKVLLSLTISISVNTLFAQESETHEVNSAEVADPVPKVNSESKKGAEKITVTGSHIKRIQVEGPSPVEILDREYLDKTGHNSVSDVLRDITASSFGGSRERSGSATADVATVNLRGLGASRTLVLMNGRRLPKDSIGAATDLNNIPFAAVERIEILKDGASALYGSDAIGGVVNIITKKNFDGFAFTTSGSFNAEDIGERFEAGSRISGSATYGVDSENLQWITVLNYRKNADYVSFLPRRAFYARL